MTQKTLDSETERFLEYTPSRDIQFDNGKVVKEYIISRSEMFEFARSIAEKTVEAVRVEERCTFVPDGEYHACVPPCEGTVQNCATMTLIGTTTTVLRQFNS